MNPTCAACGEVIIFYMHQRYSKVEGKMDYYHIECCPEAGCNPVDDNAVTAHLFEEEA